MHTALSSSHSTALARQLVDYGNREELTPRRLRLCLAAKRYTTDHEWVQVDEGKAVGTMGVTEYAQKALGDVVYVELPALGSEVATGGESALFHGPRLELTRDGPPADQIGAVESVKAASDIFAPVAGKIVEVNESLGDKPGLINQSPETDGAFPYIPHFQRLQRLWSRIVADTTAKVGSPRSSSRTPTRSRRSCLPRHTRHTARARASRRLPRASSHVASTDAAIQDRTGRGVACVAS